MRPSVRGGLQIAALAAAAASLSLAETAVGSAAISMDTQGDLAVLTRNGAETVFVADPVRRGLFAFDWPDGSQPVIGLEAFRPLPVPNVRFPTAIAVRGELLIVCDADIPAVLEVETISGRSSVLFAGPPLKRPTGVAVSASGEIAVADPGAGALLVLPREGRDLQIDRTFEAPLRVIFDEDELVVLDQARGVLRGRPGGKWSSVFPRQLDAVHDVGAYRGVYYLALGERLDATVRTAAPVRIPTPDIGRARFERLAVTARSVVGADLARRVLIRVPRPVPVTFRWSPTAEGTSSASERNEASRALSASYAYLSRNGTLPVAPITAGERAGRLDDWLVAQRVLVWPVGGAAGDGGRVGATPETFQQFERLLCDQNEGLCGAEPSPLTRAVAAGQRLILPRVNLTTFVATSAVALGGKAVREHIEERVAPLDQRRQVTASELASLNLDDPDSLEIHVMRRQLILASPASAALSVGTLLRVEAGRDFVEGNVMRACEVTGVGARAERFVLPELLRTTAANEYLPARGSALHRKPQIRASSLEVEFTGLSLEQLDAEGYRALHVLQGRPCLGGGAEARLVVTRVLKAAAARYRLLRGAELVRLSDDDVRAWGLAGRPDPARVWSFAVDGPVTIAYQAVPVGALATASASTAPLEIARVKPESPQNLLERRGGTLVLPVTAWRFDALVPASDLESPRSELHELERRHRGLAIPSPYSLRLKLASSGTCPPTDNVDLDVTRKLVQESRAALLKTINYDADLAEAVSERIAVAENALSVDTDHPAFVASDGTTVWLKPVDANRLEPRPAGQAAASEVKLKRFDLTSDHGTHVAGLLAAQPGSLSPGLVPSASLYLLDVGGASETSLFEAVTDAANRKIHVFNFSIETDEQKLLEKEVLDALHDSMQEDGKARLFIVAAGNQGKNLGKSDPAAPLRWTLTIPNILGVGSTTPDGEYILGQWTDEDGSMKDGTNFGPQYVQLVAPGRAVMSLARGNGYACATGSSQAAPQVTATAAILLANGADPVQIKARLMYTATWLAQYDTYVYAGRLNVARAVRHLYQNVVQLLSGPVDRVLALRVRGAPSLRVQNGVIVHPDGTRTVAPAQLSFDDVLSLVHIAGSQYRAFVLHDGALRVMTGQLSGTIPCAGLDVWNAGTGRFDAYPAGRETCRQGLSLNQIRSYTARLPENVKF